MDSQEEIVTLAGLQLKVEQLSGEVEALTKSTKDLVDAWNAAGAVVKFVKLIASLIAALGAIWLFFKTGFVKAH